jgi:hypothetical protein
MDTIDAATIDRLPLAGIDSVTFCKRDEITTDIISCDIEIGGETWSFHEEMAGWATLLQHLEQLPGLRADWFGAVSQPAFEAREIEAFRRS